MNTLELLLFDLGYYHFAIDIEELTYIDCLDVDKIQKVEESLNIFKNIVEIDDEKLLIMDLADLYNVDKYPENPHIAIIDMEQLYAAIKDKQVIHRVNLMFQFFEEENYILNKRFFAFLINKPISITNFAVQSLQPLPKIMNKINTHRELWGTVLFEENLYVLLDLKKLIISKIVEVY